MNVLNKMVVIPEKEYQSLKSNNKETEDGVHDNIEKTNDVTPVSLDEYKISFEKALKKYKKKPIKKVKTVKEKPSIPLIKWSSVKNF